MEDIQKVVDAVERGGSMVQKHLQDKIDRLRGQLQNCVNHLERAKRKTSNDQYDDAIESANKALYDTLNH